MVTTWRGGRAARYGGGPARVTLAPRLNPRLHLAAAIGWAVFALVTLAALVSANLAGNEAERRARADAERLLAQFATQIRHALAMNLEIRRSIVEATAAQIVASSDHGTDAMRRHLEAVQAQFPEFAWLSVADDHGRVVAATGGILHGADVSARPWFQQGLQRPFLGEVHAALLLESKLPRGPDGAPLRFVDVVAPLTQPAGHVVGVVAAHLAWAWIDRLQADLLRSLDTHRQLDLLLVAKDGRVLAGPAHWLDRTIGADTDVSDAGAYLVGRHADAAAGEGGLDWTVIVRQRAPSALAPARSTRHAVFLVVLVAGLLTAAAAVGVTRLLTRRLAVLAREAQAVRRGERNTLAVPAGTDEISRIGATLAEVVDHLQQEKHALLTLNAELDARVAERTARIERFADEARHAAVTRERLRLARDLHDTLAHSLMALLTQIRLVRKLRERLGAAELDAELVRAEEVAASGLAEARAAITQMRHNGVRDAGLGAALQELLVRFGERGGVATTLQADAPAAALADERAQTVFRIVEEALHNVERHAQARAVRVSLRWIAGSDAAPAAGSGDVRPNRVRVEVADDGVGFDAQSPHPGHYGLRGIQEQAVLIGARLGLHSAPDQGTRITLEFDA